MPDSISQIQPWKQSYFRYFWSEIAVNEHLIQIYDHKRTFLNTLEGFAGTGLLAGESVIVIATQNHLAELNARLLGQGFDIKRLQKEGRYQDIDADKLLGAFMSKDEPDKTSFKKLVGAMYKKAQRGGNKVRAFGEMVALLWEMGNKKATIELEQLWNSFMAASPLSLFCAYPRSIFKEKDELIYKICPCHSKLIAGWPHASTEVYFRDSVR